MPHQQPAIITARLAQLIRRVKARVVDAHHPVPFTARVARTPEPVAWAGRTALDYRPVAEGATWGGAWDCAWFHLQARVPAAWAGQAVVARIDLGGELLAFRPDGEPVAGLVHGSVFDDDYAKDLMEVSPGPDGTVELWLDAACNGLFGITRTDPERPHAFEALHGIHSGVVKHLHLARFDREAYALLHDLEVLRDLRQALPEGSPRAAKVLAGLDRAVSAYDREGVAACRAVLAPLLAVPANPGDLHFTAVGHAHIDTAWLWPIRETRRKTARTFASQCGLIERYPGYVFGASQAQLYQYVKEDHPGLYRRVQAAVAAGRWEVQGAMWVEADCNLPSGESLVRQVLHGKRFFKAEFGVEVRNLWLPDVFGYSGQLPQILGKAGVPFFLTQKLCWNLYNTFPHNTFVWKGLDGSEVLAHFPPENTYNARCEPGQVVKAQERHRERGLVDEAISLFGIGDGGGGPKEEYLERALRMRDLNGCPPYRFGHAQAALERLDAHRADYGVWEGELYFEMHRGTYTTQAAMKRANRRAEEALAAGEQLAAACTPAGDQAKAFDGLWKTMLTNQFHDIIPGSSIHRVYDEAVAEDEAVAARALAIGRACAAAALPAAPDRCSWYNPSPGPFDDLVELPAGWTGAARGGTALTAQADGGRVLVRLAIPGHGMAVLERTAGTPAAMTEDDGLELANEVAAYRFDRAGRLVSARLLADGEELLSGPGNDLALYEDRPHTYDAWDIDEQVKQARVGGLEGVRTVRRRGPLWSELAVDGTVGGSPLAQRIRLRPGSARLDFATTVEWRERHKLLRTSFPTVVRAEAFAGEVQYGHAMRPTHRNTTWDSARFEVCCHRWADLSERIRGVALLNDGKYGHDCAGGTLGLSLLRAPTEPDPVADLGSHRFTYALLPHAGDLFAAPQVRAEAAMLNAGALALPGLDGGGFAMPVRVEGDGLELAVVKPAEDAGGGIVVRVVEVRGAPARGRLSAPGRRIVPTDLMEWADRPQAGAEGALDLRLGAFAIETFRITG